MKQTPVIFQLLELLPELQAARATFTFSIDKKRFYLGQL
jgi:hypothetical protein